MKARTCLAIVLAAGEGTRMRSAVPKVLHAIAGRPLIAHVLAAIAEAGIADTAVVIGPGQEAVAAEARRVLPDATAFVQHEQRGTAHAAEANTKAATSFMQPILFFRTAEVVIRYMAWVNLLWVVPMIVWWRATVKGTRSRYGTT